MCFKETTSLNELMREASRVEIAHRPFDRRNLKRESSEKVTHFEASQPVPMEIRNIELKKLTAAKRDQSR